MLDFSTVKKIHFLGVGGVSMSSLARFFHCRGYSVSGSDRELSPTLIALSDEGIDVWSGFEPSKIGKPDLAVFSSAISASDVELSYIRASGVPVLERHAFLPFVSSLFRYTIAIAGTHGKTTVSSMCAEIMKTASLKFYAHIGGASKNLGGFYYSGDDYFLSEACEYRRSMLSLTPFVSAVLNAEIDHPDTYRDKTDVFDAFDDFLSSTAGIRLVNGDCDYYRLRQKHNTVVTFGFSPECDYRATDIICGKNAYFGFRILHLGVLLCSVQLRVPGKFNVSDAIAAAAVCSSLGISGETIKLGLENFNGVNRRFEFCGCCRGSDVYADYAHHPTEIKASLSTAALLNPRSLTVVFQPHTFSRTACLKDEFISALSSCENLIILKEYAARETPSDGISALNLYRECSNREKYYAENLIDAAAYLYKNSSQGGVILLLGAGDIINLAPLIVD